MKRSSRSRSNESERKRRALTLASRRLALDAEMGAMFASNCLRLGRGDAKAGESSRGELDSFVKVFFSRSRFARFHLFPVSQTVRPSRASPGSHYVTRADRPPSRLAFLRPLYPAFQTPLARRRHHAASPRGLSTCYFRAPLASRLLTSTPDHACCDSPLSLPRLRSVTSFDAVK